MPTDSESQLIAKREHLGSGASRAWVQEQDGKVSTVQVNYWEHYPEIAVRIEPADSGVAVRGWFRENGTLRLIEVEGTTDESDVTAADLRNLSAVRTLKSWEIVGREIARQALEGDGRAPDVEASSPDEALRKLTRGAAKSADYRKRGPAVEERLRLVVDAYREAIAAGDPHPRKTVAIKFGYSGEHIGRLLSHARKPRDGRPALLGPAAPGRAGETPPSRTPLR